CPDWAGMCKHVAASLYGVGARLDTDPELLFTLRDVDHLELISQAVDADNLKQALNGKADTALKDSDLGEIFGIDLEGFLGSEGADDPARKKYDSTTIANVRANMKKSTRKAIKKTKAKKKVNTR